MVFFVMMVIKGMSYALNNPTKEILYQVNTITFPLCFFVWLFSILLFTVFIQLFLVLFSEYVVELILIHTFTFFNSWKTTNTISFLFSLFGTGTVIRNFGLTATLIAFPVLMLVCTALVWVSPNIWVRDLGS